jgi:hypothetical protein
MSKIIKFGLIGIVLYVMYQKSQEKNNDETQITKKIINETNINHGNENVITFDDNTKITVDNPKSFVPGRAMQGLNELKPYNEPYKF